MKKLQLSRFGAVTAAVLFIAACLNPLAENPAEQTGAIPPGMGVLRLSLAGQQARTLFPTLGTITYTISFAGPTSNQSSVDWPETPNPYTTQLTAGTWTIRVDGKKSSDNTLLYTGSATDEIVAGQPTDMSITLKPVYSSSGTLDFSSITYDTSNNPFFTSASGLSSAELTLAGNADIPPINLMAPTTGTPPATATMAVPAGQYVLTVKLVKTNKTQAIKSEVVYIYKAETTPLSGFDFVATDFALAEMATLLRAELDPVRLTAGTDTGTGTLTLTFDKPITGLSKENITITYPDPSGGTTPIPVSNTDTNAIYWATSANLSGSGPTYTLPLKFNFTNGASPPAVALGAPLGDLTVTVPGSTLGYEIDYSPNLDGTERNNFTVPVLVPITGITGVPASLPVGSNNLAVPAANVTPTYGTPPKWSVKSTGTGATITGTASDTLTTTRGGTIEVTAKGAGTSPFTKDFNIVIYNANETNLKAKFGITTGGAAGVGEAFNTVHTYLGIAAAEGRADPHAPATIVPGDYIDLESLTIGTTSISNNDFATHKPLRLIVVGKDSFRPLAPVSGIPTPINSNENIPHVVFQFQNLPVLRSLNSPSSTEGYKDNTIRAYLTGTFLPALTNAGVPDSILWAPKRVVKKTSAVTAPVPSDAVTVQIEDKLWLPTKYEVFGDSTPSATTGERAANSVQFEYYNDDDSRKKYNPPTIAAQEYWLATSATTAEFAVVKDDGTVEERRAANADNVYGIAPAFCVK